MEASYINLRKGDIQSVSGSMDHAYEQLRLSVRPAAKPQTQSLTAVKVILVVVVIAVLAAMGVAVLAIFMNQQDKIHNLEPTVDGPPPTEASSSNSPSTTLIITGASASLSPVASAPSTLIRRPTTTTPENDRLSTGASASPSPVAPVPTTMIPIPTATTPEKGTKLPTSCYDIHSSDRNALSGLHTVHIGGLKRQVWCDMETDGGGWTVFQRRQNGTESFDRTWQEYRKGFGSAGAEFWLGNDDLHLLTAQPSELRVELLDFNNKHHRHGYAHYSNFRIDSEMSNYRLHVGKYNGNIGDSLTYPHNFMEFSTKDRDNDRSSYNCATEWGGGWWYSKCYYANLNRRYIYYRDGAIKCGGVYWGDHDYKAATMMTRPVTSSMQQHRLE